MISILKGEHLPCGHPEACRIYVQPPSTFVLGQPTVKLAPTERCGWCEAVARQAAKSAKLRMALITFHQQMEESKHAPCYERHNAIWEAAVELDVVLVDLLCPGADTTP